MQYSKKKSYETVERKSYYLDRNSKKSAFSPPRFRERVKYVYPSTSQSKYYTSNRDLIRSSNIVRKTDVETRYKDETRFRLPPRVQYSSSIEYAPSSHTRYYSTVPSSQYPSQSRLSSSSYSQPSVVTYAPVVSVPPSSHYVSKTYSSVPTSSLPPTQSIGRNMYVRDLYSAVEKEIPTRRYAPSSRIRPLEREVSTVRLERSRYSAPTSRYYPSYETSSLRNRYSTMESAIRPRIVLPPRREYLPSTGERPRRPRFIPEPRESRKYDYVPSRRSGIKRGRGRGPDPFYSSLNNEKLSKKRKYEEFPAVILENVNRNMNESEIKNYFNDCGKIRQVRFLCKVIVAYERKESVKKSLEISGAMFDDQMIVVRKVNDFTVETSFFTSSRIPFMGVEDEFGRIGKLKSIEFRRVPSSRVIVEFFDQPTFATALRAHFGDFCENKMNVREKKRNVVYKQVKVLTSSDTSQKKIEKNFRPCGEIESVQRVNNGYCVIMFENEKCMKEVKRCSGTEIKGDKISVKRVGKREVLVSSLNENVSKEDVIEVFEKVGKIKSINMKLGGVSVTSIKFLSMDSVGKALKLNGKNIDETEIIVNPMD